MEKQNKSLLILIITLIFAAVTAFYVSQLSINKSHIIDLPAAGSDRADVYSVNDRLAFETYLRANLSKLSPEKEVLGGTFYLTAIDWETDRTAYINYEDGHIALNARVGFSLSKADDKAVQVDYFKVIPANQGEDAASAEVMIVE